MNHLPELQIDPKAIKAWRVTGLTVGLLWFLIPAGYYYLDGFDEYNIAIQITLIGVALILYLFTGLVVPVIRWKRWRYELTENEIDLLRGFIIRKRTLIPINRVQHVDSSHGPVYRKFHLSSIKVSTAATTHIIPALDDETAVEVRNRISQLVRKAKEDV